MGFEIFWKFTKDTLLTGGIYILLVIATLILRYFAHQLEESTVQFKVVVFLEYGIFFSGSLVVVLILIYVTVLTVVELFNSFRFALAAGNLDNDQDNED